MTYGAGKQTLSLAGMSIAINQMCTLDLIQVQERQ